MGFHEVYPAWLCQNSYSEHGPVEIVSLTIKNVVNIQKTIEHGHRNSEFNIV